MRASSVVNRQLTAPPRAFRSASHAATSRSKRLAVGDAPVEALAAHGAQLDLRDVQPAPVLRACSGSPACRPAAWPRPAGTPRRAGRRVGVQVVQHQDDPLGVRVAHVDQVLDDVRPVQLGPPLGDLTCRCPRSGSHRGTGCGPAPLVLVVVRACAARRAGRRGRASARNCLLASSRQTCGRRGSYGRRVDVQHVLHPPDELAALLGRDAPALREPRLEPVLLEHLADRLVGDAVDVAQLDQLVGQQPQGPASPPDGWRRAGQGDQVGLLLTVQLRVGTRAEVVGGGALPPAPARRSACGPARRSRCSLEGGRDAASVQAGRSGRRRP